MSAPAAPGAAAAVSVSVLLSATPHSARRAAREASLSGAVPANRESSRALALSLRPSPGSPCGPGSPRGRVSQSLPSRMPAAGVSPVVTLPMPSTAAPQAAAMPSSIRLSTSARLIFMPLEK